MTNNLRKVHTFVWLALMVFVPLLIVFSVLELNKPIKTKITTSLPELPKAENAIVNSDQFNIQLNRQFHGQELQIVLKKPLAHASAVVYEANSEESKGNYLGTLNEIGTYKFTLKSTAKFLKIVDGIKNETIVNIKL